MAKSNVTKRLRGKDAEREILKALARGQQAMGFQMQAEIVKGFTSYNNPRPPIDSGQLRQSVQYKTKGSLKGEIEVSKDYAVYVEFGTSKMPPRPFLRDGIRKGEEPAGKKLIAELDKIKDLV